MQNSLLSTEECSKTGEELVSTALQLSQPRGVRGQDVRRPVGWLNFLGILENEEAVQLRCSARPGTVSPGRAVEDKALPTSAQCRDARRRERKHHTLTL